MASTKQFTLFGLHDLHVKLPADLNTAWVQMVGASDAAYKGEVSEVEQLGDDQRLGVFFHTQKGTITAKCSIETVAALEKLSGVSASISAVGTGPNNSGQSVDALDIQNLSELLPPYVTVRASVKGRKTDGTAGYMYMYWFKCLCKTVWEASAGGSYGKITEPALTIETFSSAFNELNVALTNGNAFGRVEYP
jgi:hypothetical protein